MITGTLLFLPLGIFEYVMWLRPGSGIAGDSDACTTDWRIVSALVGGVSQA